METKSNETIHCTLDRETRLRVLPYQLNGQTFFWFIEETFACNVSRVLVDHVQTLETSLKGEEKFKDLTFCEMKFTIRVSSKSVQLSIKVSTLPITNCRPKSLPRPFEIPQPPLTSLDISSVDKTTTTIDKFGSNNGLDGQQVMCTFRSKKRTVRGLKIFDLLLSFLKFLIHPPGLS